TIRTPKPAPAATAPDNNAGVLTENPVITAPIAVSTMDPPSTRRRENRLTSMGVRACTSMTHPIMVPRNRLLSPGASARVTGINEYSVKKIARPNDATAVSAANGAHAESFIFSIRFVDHNNNSAGRNQIKKAYHPEQRPCSCRASYRFQVEQSISHFLSAANLSTFSVSKPVNNYGMAFGKPRP